MMKKIGYERYRGYTIIYRQSHKGGGVWCDIHKHGKPQNTYWGVNYQDSYEIAHKHIDEWIKHKEERKQLLKSKHKFIE